MKTLILKPAVEKITGGWQGKAALYENNFHVGTELSNAYDDKQETWNELVKYAQEFADSHNKNCNCGIKMEVGSY